MKGLCRKVVFGFVTVRRFSASLPSASRKLERAASTDRAKVIAAIAPSTFNDHIMPYGPTKFVNGQNEGAQAVNTQIRGDKIEVIFPKEFASAAPIFPNPSKG